MSPTIPNEQASDSTLHDPEEGSAQLPSTLPETMSTEQSESLRDKPNETQPAHDANPQVASLIELPRVGGRSVAAWALGLVALAALVLIAVVARHPSPIDQNKVHGTGDETTPAGQAHP